MLRAGPFSDERVVRLVNRRFIPFFFDLSNRGAAGDADARRFVVAKRARLGGRSIPPPDLLVMSSTGEVVAEISNFATPDAMLLALQKVLREHPELAEPTAEERALQGTEKAELCIDLLDYSGAIEALAEVETDRAHYLRGRIQRFLGNAQSAEASFAKVQDTSLRADVRMERARLCWLRGEFEDLAQRLADFPRTSKRYTEARYYQGLACYHLGNQDEARAIWKDAIKTCDQDRWIYRADWAYCATLQPAGRAGRSGRSGRSTFSSSARRVSPLHRIGYMGPRNPDLKARKR